MDIIINTVKAHSKHLLKHCGFICDVLQHPILDGNFKMFLVPCRIEWIRIMPVGPWHPHVTLPRGFAKYVALSGQIASFKTFR